jgi:hypothetical protein
VFFKAVCVKMAIFWDLRMKIMPYFETSTCLTKTTDKENFKNLSAIYPSEVKSRYLNEFYTF